MAEGFDRQIARKVLDAHQVTGDLASLEQIAELLAEAAREGYVLGFGAAS